MVTGEWMRQKLVEPLKEKQRQEGRVEAEERVNRLWWEWNERRLEAESKGKPFSEPVPYVPNGTAQAQNGSKE